MQYYIVKKDDTLDKILNKFGLTYQKFISLNSSNINELIKVGNKILVNNSNFNRSYKDDINKIYLDNQYENEEELKYICPHCKNIIIIPKQNF
jgi:LysM repeat protein